MIAGSVNNDFEPSEKLTDWPLERDWSPRADRAGVGGPLVVDGRGVTSGITH